MGWTTGWNTRNSLIHDLTKDESVNATHSLTCLRHCTRGNILWSVWDCHNKQTDVHETHIRCDKMQNYGGSNGWGYKDMCESMHPYYYTCPISYLELANSGINESWREEVLNHHNKIQERRRRARKIYKEMKEQHAN